MQGPLQIVDFKHGKYQLLGDPWTYINLVSQPHWQLNALYVHNPITSNHHVYSCLR